MSATPKSQQQPIVFVVDDDISVRESLESLIAFAGWQPETFRQLVNFSRARALARQVVWCSTFLFPTLTVWNCRSW
jgi:FixJ family two-component response regulator